MINELPLVPFVIINFTSLTAGVCMKVRFRSKVTRRFSFSPLRNSHSPLRGSLTRGKFKKNLWDQGILIFGLRLFLLVISCPALFLTIVPLCFLCPSLFHLGLVYGNLLSRFWKKKSIFNLFVTFGLLGDVASISLLPWRGGGRWVRVGLRVLRSVTVLDGLGLLRKSAIS